MADVTLSTGRVIVFDFNKITFREWRGILDSTEANDISEEKVARVGGLSLDELLDLSYPDHYLYMQEFWKRARDPLADPKNSPSVPTLP